MARGLLADPDLPHKAREGRAHLIDHCIACNQGCFDSIFNLKAATCLVNPRAGHEGEWRVEPAARPKRVLVIGGGPAGMKCARTAAERGHQVILAEKSRRLGGQLQLNRRIPGRQEMATAAHDLIHHLGHLKVELRLGEVVTAARVKEWAPEAVVIATGAVPQKPPLPGIDRPQVVQSWDVLDGRVGVGRRVVIIGGNAVGLETALYLAQQGTLPPEVLHFLMANRAEPMETLLQMIDRGNKEVVVLEMLKRAGKDIGQSTRWTVMAELQRLGVSVMTNTRAVAVKDGFVEVEKDGQSEELPADSVVIAAGSLSERGLAAALEGLVPEIHVIGDAAEPRKALEAVREGFLTGLKL